MPVRTDKKSVFSLYRTFHRQIRLLPTNYLRHVLPLRTLPPTAVLQTYDLQRRATKIKRVQSELERLRLANRGVRKKFDHVLDLAYGRKGKLRWELLQPLLSDPASPLPDRIIPSVERSRPPVISPEMTALMANGISRSSRAPALKRIQSAPLPERANPNSAAAHLLGPFSKRREVNIRWRYFTKQLHAVYPPVEVGVDQSRAITSKDHRTDRASLERAGVRPMLLQEAGIMEELESLAVTGCLPSGEPVFATHYLRRRFLRQRFASLLGRIPLLTYSEALVDTKREASGHKTTETPNGYMVSLSPVASRDQRSRAHDADETDAAWFQWAMDQSRKKAAKRNRGAER
ncbi:hypothetical protein DAEQUDRAFT_761033 [Daedalea quercina L-15889]|uniref:LYR motif-containing protein Cup1-like N-terminal domain-containing protein n=1 Tax=Daedalea quercina L-15889 TaxID=1314783 RepID=A0A165UKT9_9APHY|nr:hypothetical protein DAEQUDRAFT_761033 [Daedalea quercina L-15889]